jgi:hypothetical protein
MDPNLAVSVTKILGPIWVTLVGAGMLFFALGRNVTLKRRLWPIYMFALWLFVIPVVLWFRLPLPLAAFGVLSWGLLVFFNYRSWFFCPGCGASSRVAFSTRPRDACPKCGSQVPADV